LRPKANTDGTIDYTVTNRHIRREASRSVATAGACWTLRLPNTIPLTVADDSKAQFFPNGLGGGAITFYPHANDYVSLDLAWPHLLPPPPKPAEDYFWNHTDIAELTRVNPIDVFPSND
jgi:hypothetical protein